MNYTKLKREFDAKIEARKEDEDNEAYGESMKDLEITIL